MNTKLAKKLYDAARQYLILEKFKAAMRYFDDVIEQYHDTEYAPLAYIDKIELLISRTKYREAQAEISRFISRYPNSVLRGRIDLLLQKVARELGDAPAARRGNASILPPSEMSSRAE